MTLNQIKIFIGSDPIATKEKEQFSNRRWLKDILERPIFAVSNLRAVNFTSSLALSDLFDRRVFFRLSGITLDIEQTHFYYDPDNINSESINYLRQFIPDNSIYIGYELSEQTRSIFIRAGVKFIDIWLHPVRFLDDVVFGVGSNVESIRKSLQNYNVDEYLYYMYADRLRIQSYKGWRRNEIEIVQNSALFVGQMLNDKSICRDGKMLSAIDFKDEFSNLSRTHDSVLYSRHPYLRRGDEEILQYVLSFPNVKISDMPTYSMLSHKNIKTVMGVSSSVLVEAKYFGKKVKTLYKPVINISNDAPDSYSSVYNNIINPKFWADILSSVLTVNDHSSFYYTSGKDKIRDMLGFYWSYKEIDKVEEMRNGTEKQLVKPAPVLVETSKRVPLRKFTIQQTENNAAILAKQLKKHGTVSFDIFETLIERLLDKPADMFNFMERDFIEILGGKYQGFAQLRASSRGWAHSKGGFKDEVPLYDRYIALKDRLGLDYEKTMELMQCELEYERRLCRPKYLGSFLFNEAVKSKKRIILISDTYFDRAFVEELLRLNGFNQWDAIYLSSEHNATKSTGRLFDVVLGKENLKPRSIVHIGDNLTSDIKNAAEKGITTIHVPERAELIENHIPLSSAYNGIANDLMRSATLGLVGAEYSRGMRSAVKSYTGGEVEKLGYCVTGPIFFGLAKWILDQAREQGVEELFFLSRDGHIIKRCYDIIAMYCDDAPKSTYLYASRRATRVAELFTIDDILRTLETNFSPMPIGDLLFNRFGVHATSIDNKVFTRHGFDDGYAIADWKVAKERICAFFSDKSVQSAILSNAKKERKLLVKYYTEAGMTTDKFVGIVDIGHSGTIQAAIIRILGLKKSLGLYFATFDDIKNNLPAGNHNSLGYILKDGSSGNKKIPYVKYILMYELLFLNSEDSFSHLSIENGVEKMNFINTINDEQRKQFADILHNNIVRFTDDLTKLFPRHIDQFSVAGSEITNCYNALLNNAYLHDIQIFSGLSFENNYSGRVSRWIVPPLDDRLSEPGIWAEAINRIRKANGSSADELLGWRKHAHSILRGIIWKSNVRKATKFEQDASRYFSDSSWKVVRNIGQIVYDKKTN